MTETGARELLDILKDLTEADSEARAEGFTEPSSAAKINAEQLIRKMYTLSPRHLEVYPMPDAEIAVDIPCDHGKSIVLFCGSRGEVFCSINKNGKHRRARFFSADELTDNFAREALADMDQ